MLSTLSLIVLLQSSPGWTTSRRPLVVWRSAAEVPEAMRARIPADFDFTRYELAPEYPNMGWTLVRPSIRQTSKAIIVRDRDERPCNCGGATREESAPTVPKLCVLPRSGKPVILELTQADCGPCGAVP